MQDYSHKSSENISPNFNRLLILAEILKTTEVKREDFIKRKYEDQAVDYDVSISFFELFGFVKVSNGKILPRNKFRELLTKNAGIEPNKLKELLVDGILSDEAHSQSLNEFLGLFKKTKKDMILRLTTDERLKYSGIRNLFLELGLIEYVPSSDVYKVEHRLVPKVDQAIRRIKNSPLSAEQFAKILIAQEDLGAKAELRVIQYEKDRLASHPPLVNAIEHTALINVGAGYDILSWEKPIKDSAKSLERYIEVKAVSPRDYGFMWTSNEIERASTLQNKYYLYLVPVLSLGKFDTENMEVIANPYKNVFLNKKVWTKSEKVYTIRKLEQINE